MARWGLKPCVHPQFLEVAGEADKRACVQCGEFLDDIVQESSHPEGSALNAAELGADRCSLHAAQQSAAPQREPTRTACMELPRVRQATRGLPQYNHSFAARPQGAEERRIGELTPLPGMSEKPTVAGNAIGWTPRQRLYVSPLQRALLERLRERFPVYLAPVFEQEIGSALLVDTAACERLLQVIPHSGRTGNSLYRKVAYLLDVVRRKKVPSVENQERTDESFS